jgi:hypothetical protein
MNPLLRSADGLASLPFLEAFRSSSRIPGILNHRNRFLPSQDTTLSHLFLAVPEPAVDRLRVREEHLDRTRGVPGQITAPVIECIAGSGDRRYRYRRPRQLAARHGEGAGRKQAAGGRGRLTGLLKLHDLQVGGVGWGAPLKGEGREGVDGPHSQIRRTPTSIYFGPRWASTLERAVCEWPLIQSETFT